MLPITAGSWVDIAPVPNRPFMEVEKDMKDKYNVPQGITVGKVASIVNGFAVVHRFFARDSYSVPVECLKNLHPTDAKGDVLTIGDSLLICVKNEMVKAKVVDFGKPKHHGCGWCEVGIQVQPEEQGAKKISQFYPKGRWRL